jgi:DHA2 family multidrug resistance protein
MAQRSATVTPDSAQAFLGARGIIARSVTQQAITIAFDDVFRVMCWMFLAALLMVPFAKAGSRRAAPITR